MGLSGSVFYSRSTKEVASDLIGKKLVRIFDDGSGKLIRLSGIISETEAYGSKDDPASHAFNGMTNRNSVMFGDVGKAYVYFIYGVHHCMNVTAHSPAHDAGAVLIRSLIPTEGISSMMSRCHVQNKLNLTNGPGKLTRALDINRSHNGLSLSDRQSLLHIEDGIKPDKIVSTTRIGISRAREKHWRYLIVDDR